MLIALLLLPALLLFEITLINTPIVLIFLLCLLVIRKERWVFAIGFVSGILLDILLVRQIGVTALFIITTLFLVMLYQRKFEIATYYFVTIAAFLIAFVYAVLLQIGHPLFHATASSILAILFFAMLQRIFTKA